MDVQGSPTPSSCLSMVIDSHHGSMSAKTLFHPPVTFPGMSAHGSTTARSGPAYPTPRGKSGQMALFRRILKAYPPLKHGGGFDPSTVPSNSFPQPRPALQQHCGGGNFDPSQSYIGEQPSRPTYQQYARHPQPAPVQHPYPQTVYQQSMNQQPNQYGIQPAPVQQYGAQPGFVGQILRCFCL